MTFSAPKKLPNILPILKSIHKRAVPTPDTRVSSPTQTCISNIYSVLSKALRRALIKSSNDSNICRSIPKRFEVRVPIRHEYHIPYLVGHIPQDVLDQLRLIAT